MYSNYGITINTRLKIKDIIKLLIKAYEKEQTNNLWDMWLIQFANMDKENYISFEDYKNKLISKNHTQISYKDIEKEMDLVEKTFANK